MENQRSRVKGYSPEIEARIARNEKKREEKIYRLCSLYKRWCGLTGREYLERDLDEMINKRFKVDDGIRSLSFESADKVIKGLELSIEQMEGG